MAKLVNTQNNRIPNPKKNASIYPLNLTAIPILTAQVMREKRSEERRVRKSIRRIKKGRKGRKIKRKRSAQRKKLRRVLVMPGENMALCARPISS